MRYPEFKFTYYRGPGPDDVVIFMNGKKVQEFTDAASRAELETQGNIADLP